MLEVISAEYIDGYRIRIQFSDGREGDVDLSDVLWGPVFEPLRDIAAFRRFRVSCVLHTIQWENGADLAPECLCDKIIPIHAASELQLLRREYAGGEK